jgi:hypothetical protein
MPIDYQQLSEPEADLRTAVCREHLRLSDDVVAAVKAVYDTKAALDLAKKAKTDFASLAKLLDQYRTAEREAVAALTQHRREHNC